MSPNDFALFWANHLWQSTLFVAGTAALAFVLRRNYARTRYCLWLVASVKFLVPFAFLTALGRALGSLTGWLSPIRIVHSEVRIVIDQVGRRLPLLPPSGPLTPSFVDRALGVLPALLAAVWICGFLALAFSWVRRWRGVRAAVSAAAPLPLEADIPVLSSRAMLEPGVFGIFRPVLLLPEGIADRLGPAHLQAILAHESCHVRRRDNLAAAMHMLVEAIFWFHPLVWWVGARLVEERENACDEEVLGRGSRPEVYAESILKTCQFYLESPLACMSGIAGADLKKRIARIMTRPLADRLTLGRKMLLGAAGAAAVAGPILLGLMNAPRVRAQSQVVALGAPHLSFDVASVKPNRSGTGLFKIGMDPGRFVADNASLKFLVQAAYGVKASQIFAGPRWIDSEHYDIEAKREDPTSGTRDKLDGDAGDDKVRLMLQSLLADRFQLALHHETKELPIYALLVAKNGAKFHESAAPHVSEDADGNIPLGETGPQPRHSVRMNGRGDLSVVAENLDMFADLLSHQLGRLVVNKTGLGGDYDFTLKWTPDGDAAVAPDAAGASIFVAMQEQLGLKLESQKGPVDILVIDHAEKPSEN